MNALTGAMSAVGLLPLLGHDRRRFCVFTSRWVSRSAPSLFAFITCVTFQNRKSSKLFEFQPLLLVSLSLKNLQVQTCECAHGKYKETGKGTLTFRSGNSSRWAPYCWPPSPVNPVRTSAGFPIHSHFLDTPFQP